MELKNRSGSHAGRGFRYQDAVAAWLAVRAWAGTDPQGIIIPEGGDDVERRTSSGSAFIQVKSRREHLGALPIASARNYIRELWQRHDHAAAQPDTLELIVERGIVDLDTDQEGNVAVTDRLASSLPSGSRAVGLLAKTKLTHMRSPLQDSVRTIEEKSGCSPLAAEICFAQLLVTVGTLANENGRLIPTDYRGLSSSDTDGIINSTLAAVDHSHIERALRDGACEPVDFLTPLDDTDFYLGVDVQPGHVVAGLVLSRIAPREALARGLEVRGAAMVAGASGSGKSAIMWDTAFALRHTVRWYRLLRLDQRDIAAIRQLLRTLRASVDSPVGLVVDDVGRRGAEGWDALTRELAAIPGAILLGSIREEDMFLLSGRSRVTEVRAEPDADLAQRLYQELKCAGRTSWPGWHEAWQLSDGLILEYVHILTAGRRFEETLADQVSARLREPERSTELAVLRIVAFAGAAGAAVEAGRLPAIIGVSEDEVARGLRRLIDEHLVQSSGAGLLTGLHQLRSAELLRQTHMVPPPSPEASFANAIHTVPAADLEPLVADGIMARGIAVVATIQALIARLIGNPEIDALAAGLRGLATAQIMTAVDQWLSLPCTQLLPRTQVGSAAIFGVAGIEVSDFDKLRDIANAAAELVAIKNDPVGDPRAVLLDAMPPSLLASMISDVDAAASLNRLLSSMIGMPFNAVVRAALAAHTCAFLKGPLDDVAGLLGTLAVLDRSLAIAWVDQAGARATIERLQCEVAWASAPTLEQAPDGPVTRCNYWWISDSIQTDPHSAVVRICELVLALSPRSEIAASTALAPNGEVAGSSIVPLAEMRIPRGNLPTAAIPVWNRRWRDAIAGRVATPSYSIYLSRAADITGRLVPLLKRIFDAYLRGRSVAPALLESLGNIYTEAEALTPPGVAVASATGTGSGEPNTAVTKLQNVLFSASANVLRRFAKLPDGAGAYIAWLGDLIEQVDAAVEEEPWQLIGADVPASLGHMRELLAAMRELAGKSYANGLNPVQHWKGVVRKARQGNALRMAATAAGAQSSRQREVLVQNLRKRAEEACLNVDIRIREDHKAILPWPPSEVLGLLSSTSIHEAASAVDAVAPALRKLVDDKMRLTVVAVVDGQALPDLSLSGYETLFPLSDAVDSWISKLCLSTFRSRAVVALDKAITFASGLESMDRLALGMEGRSPVELEGRETLEMLLIKAGDEFDRVCMPVSLELATAGRNLLLHARSGDLAFADATHEALHGGTPASLLEFAELRIEIAQAEMDKRLFE